jgi:hypothetical protein
VPSDRRRVPARSSTACRVTWCGRASTSCPWAPRCARSSTSTPAASRTGAS